ncbi:MAG: galactose mutarotase [Clostridiales Family XIII bacterium]|jgi:aldose 1-epimerase|nr:galactose mutarotase [Clostridiales Family XIII bacterium]
MNQTPFGNSKASLFTLENGNGTRVTLTDVGASIVGAVIVAKDGRPIDVVLGYDDPQAYFDCKSFFGATVGRVANRISGAAFTLGGERFLLEANDGGNTLHGGFSPYSNRLWEASEAGEAGNAVEFSLFSSDGDQGFPGDARVRVRYALTDDDRIRIEYRAETNKATPFNLTNHAYFNMDGHDAGPAAMAEQFLWLDCGRFTESDGSLITTGRLIDVEGTPLDFRLGRRIGDGLDADYGPLRLAGGYDHNFVVGASPGKPVARLWSERSGLELQVFTDMPGIQFYSGNHMTEEKGKDGAVYGYRGACCLETQFYPDSPNRPEFPSCVFEAGRPFVSVTEYRLVARQPRAE